MRDVYKNVRFYDDLKDLEDQARKAVERDSRMIDLTNEYMTTLGKSRGETETQIEENNRRAIGSIKSNFVPEVNTVRLAQGEIRKRPSVYDDYGKTERKSREQTRKTSKEKSFNLKKIAIAASLTIALAGGGAYMAAVTKAQEESFERATEIVNIVDAGDYHPQLSGYELVVQANGDCFFRDVDGMTFGQYGEGENAITADEVGEMLEKIDQSKQR